MGDGNTAIADKGWSRAAWVILCTAVVALPLATSNLTGLGIGSAAMLLNEPELAKFAFLMALVPAGLLAWAIGVASSRTLRHTHALLALAGAGVWMALATILAPDPVLTLLGDGVRYEGLLTYLAYFGLFFLTLQLVLGADHTAKLISVVAVSGTVGAAYGLLQVLGIDPASHGQLSFEGNRAFATFGNPDYFGGWVQMCLPLALSLAYTSDGLRKKLWWGATVVVALALLFTFTRGAWLGGAVSMFIMVVVIIRSGRRPSVVDTVFAASAGVAVLAGTVISMGSASESTNVIQRVTSMFSAPTGSSLTRVLTWQAAIQSVRTYPLFGVGPDSFALAFNRFMPDAYVTAAGPGLLENNAHSLPLQLAATIGIPGAMLILGAVAWVLASAWRSGPGAPRGRDRIVQASLWAAVAGHLTFLLFDPSVIGSGTIMWVLLGALAAPAARSISLGRWRLAPAIIALLLVIAGPLTVVPNVAADLSARQAVLAPDVDTAVGYAEKARMLAPASGQYSVLYGNVRTASMAQHHGADVLALDHSAARSAIEPVAKRQLYGAESWIALVDTDLRYAFATGQPEDFAAAAQTARQALDRLPNNPILLLQSGTALLELGDTGGARDAAERVLEMSPGYAPATQLLDSAAARNAE